MLDTENVLRVDINLERLKRRVEQLTVKRKMSFFEFCERLKDDGAYIGEDWHIYRKDGRPLSRMMRNGYYTLRKMYDSIEYTFMEHRIIWYFINGEYNEDLVINHIDFDRTNNNIENLELVTPKENVHHMMNANRLKVHKGEDNGRSVFTNKEVQAIRYMGQHGWSISQLQKMFDIKWSDTIGRVIRGARYGSISDAQDIVSIYPAIVSRTWRNDIEKEERVKNALFGLNGEVGELTDVFKKYFYHDHDLDVDHVMMELGDILYYLCALCIEEEIDFSDLCYTNAHKLLKRYPDGFEAERSLNRAEGDI